MFRFLTAGESHGPSLTAVIEGMPAGVDINIELIDIELRRRQMGYGRGGRMNIEHDKVKILSGVRFGQTIGSPITLQINNRDWLNWEARMSVAGTPTGERVTSPRPGHADLTGILKYDRNDVRDVLERASARETAVRVAVGAIAKQLLSIFGITVVSHVVNVGGVVVANVPHEELLNRKSQSDLNCADPGVEAKMKNAITTAKEQGDTLGGMFEVIALNVMPGLGSYVHWDRRLDAQLAAAVMSIPAIKGVEFGAGFKYADLPGSRVHDEIYYSADKGYYRFTNHAGGLEGGMSNGESIILRAVMKPIPTLMKPLASVDIDTKEAVFANTERSDVCAVSAASVVGEAMVAIVLAQALLDKFGHDNLADLQRSVRQYLDRIGWSR